MRIEKPKKCEQPQDRPRRKKGMVSLINNQGIHWSTEQHQSKENTYSAHSDMPKEYVSTYYMQKIVLL